MAASKTTPQNKKTQTKKADKNEKGFEEAL